MTSPGFPFAYGNREHCTLRPIAHAPLEVRAFSTESGFDFLTVNGYRFSGSPPHTNSRWPSLDGIVPSRDITW